MGALCNFKQVEQILSNLISNENIMLYDCAVFHFQCFPCKKCNCQKVDLILPILLKSIHLTYEKIFPVSHSNFCEPTL